MKRLLSSLALVAALSVSASAGEIPFPPAPPACTQNCTQAAPQPTPLPQIVVEILIKLLT